MNAWRRFCRRPRSRFGLAVLTGLVCVAACADFLASDRPIWLQYRSRTYWLPNLIDYPALRGFDNQRLLRSFTAGDRAVFPLLREGPYFIPPPGDLAAPPPAGPSRAHPLGTDGSGRDVLARLLHGTRSSLFIGLAAVALYLALGVPLGLFAGYAGGFVDAAVSRLTELVLNFPLLFLLVAVQGLLRRTSIFSTLAVIGLTRWTEACRLARAETLRLKQLDFIQASRALGNSTAGTLLRHVLPNALPPLLVAATFEVGAVILIESSLSFLGFGAPEPTASWGLLLNDGFANVLDPQARLLVLAPGLAIFLTVAALNLVGEGLREALDPRAEPPHPV
jgi:peptide/nickel transport system permease protein